MIKLWTAEWLLAAADKMVRGLQEGKVFCPAMSSTSTTPPSSEDEPLPYCSVVKKIKKENVTPANLGEIILCQIPGISTVSAVTIMQKFNGSLLAMTDALRADPHALDGIQCESKGKLRKLSKTIVKHIYEFLIQPL